MPSTKKPLLVGLGLLFTAGALLGLKPRISPAGAGTASPPPAVSPDATLASAPANALLPRERWEPALPLSEPLRQALGARKHAEALAILQAMPLSELRGAQVGDQAFLQAWSLVRAEKGAQALPLRELVLASEQAPEPYRQLVLGEALLAAGQPVEAAQALETVDPRAAIAPRARLARAKALFDAGRTAESKAIYEELAARPDPASGSEVALWALANRAGIGSPAARPLLRRLYRHYPATREGRLAAEALGTTVDLADKAWRADAWMEGGSFKEVGDLITPIQASYASPSVEACVALYAHGRSHFRRNNASLAAQILEPLGKGCRGLDEDRGAKALYVAGKALERKKEWAAAAAAYEQIPALYPGHRMADDGHALAGIAWQQAGQPGRAVKAWEAQVTAYPDGDLAAEGFWRLAWTAWLDGDTPRALDWAERSIRTVKVTDDPVHALAARYWAGRWRVHPRLDQPQQRNPDPAAFAEGIERLLALCREYPSSFYALLAASRLYELAPDRLATIPRPPRQAPAEGLHVRPDFEQVPHHAWGLALARLGLVKEALAELQQTPEEELSPSEYALQAAILEGTEPFAAHDRLHHYLLSHPPETLGPDRDRILAMAYPETYWKEVQQATSGYGWDGRIFHALVREESSFNPQARSWAGALGLSQLMPATAASVGRPLGYGGNTAQLTADPLLNLRIGARYYQGLVERFKGNLFLATPSYNAGEGNIERWIAQDPGRPTDQFIEAIPLRETRHYVKRVMGTWQIYRLSYDDGPVFPDLSAFNHKLR